MRRRLGQQTDTGAVAVVVAIAAVALFGVSALAVELTDMYSRDRAVQTTADLAAFAGAQELPSTCDAFNAAHDNLSDPNNGVRTDSGTATFGASAVDLSDTDPSNGEIEILDAGEQPITGCEETGRYVRVTTPPRNLKFSFGAAVGGSSGGAVQATAMVELRGLEANVLPFSLPAVCPSGPNYIYAAPGFNVRDPSGVISYSPGGHTLGPVLGPVTPFPTTTPTSLTVDVSDLRANPSETGNEVGFDFHLLRSNGSTLRVPTSPPAGVTGALVGSPVATSSPARWSAAFNVVVPATVSSTPGSWKVRARQGGSGTGRYTNSGAEGTLVVGDASAAACPTPSTGNFGLLRSPRSDGANENERRALNILLGIDHALGIVTSSVIDKACQGDRHATYYPDAILDNDPSTDGANCADIKPGGSRDFVTNGLIDGAGGLDGRLVRPVPSAASGPDCRVQNDGDMRASLSGSPVVDTALSCYLSGTSTLTDVRSGIAGSLRLDIAEDPRFFFLPVLHTSDRPSNADGGDRFWPISEFRGAFLTNEIAGGDAICSNDENCNGILLNPGGQIMALQAFTFPLSALPEEIDQPGNGGVYYGGPKDLLLVE